MFNKITKKTAWMALPIASLLMVTGCEEEATSAPAAPATDLTQTEDLFSQQAVRPNPIANDPSAVVVRVNGEEITRGEIMAQLNANMQQLAGRMSPEQMQQIAGQIYGSIQDQMISQKLLEAAVAASDTTVDEAKLAAEIEAIRANFAAQPNKPEGVESLEDLLAMQGSSIEELTADIRQQMAAQAFLETKVAGVKEVSQEDAQAFYDENPDNFVRPESVSASHILIGIEEEEAEESKAAKKAQLEEIRAEIIAGTTTFEEAAKEYSTCQSGQGGGSLGTFGKGRMVPEFEVAAFTQEKGEIGEIVTSPFGYHLIKVTDHQDEGTISFDEAQERIVAYLTNQKKQEIVSNYLKSLREDAEIEFVEQ